MWGGGWLELHQSCVYYNITVNQWMCFDSACMCWEWGALQTTTVTTDAVFVCALMSCALLIVDFELVLFAVTCL